MEIFKRASLAGVVGVAMTLHFDTPEMCQEARKQLRAFQQLPNDSGDATDFSDQVADMDHAHLLDILKTIQEASTGIDDDLVQARLRLVFIAGLTYGLRRHLGAPREELPLEFSHRLVRPRDGEPAQGAAA